MSSTSDDRWIVLKFGGTSVSRRHRWDTIGRLAKRRAQEHDARVLVVVSALSGVTNELTAIADGAADPDARVAALIERHRAFVTELELDVDAVLGARLAALQALVTDARATTRTLDWQAEVLAQHFLDLEAHGVAGVQGGHRVLEDHGQVLADDMPALAAFLRAGRQDAVWQVRPVALYAGWLTAATGASFGLVLGGFGVMSEQAAAILCLLAVTGAALAVQAARPPALRARRSGSLTWSGPHAGLGYVQASRIRSIAAGAPCATACDHVTRPS